MRKVDGVEEFCVAWAAAWMPKSDLGGAREFLDEFLDEFKARLSVLHMNKNGTHITGEKMSKILRGRLPKRP
jgi:hypothetical protein